MSLIEYQGESKVTKRICELLNVTDVQVNGVSVVDENGIADVSGGGGGSTVSWNQIQTTGTKIAEITINGTETDVYSPNGSGSAEELNDLTDVTISTPTDNQVLNYDDNNNLWINKTITKEVTQAQYDALPDTKLTDGVTYYITDGAPSNATINGVFIDTSNVIVERTTYTQTQDFTYTATQDCAIFIEVVNIPGSGKTIRIDDVWVESLYSSSEQIRVGNTYYLRKGQTLTVLANASAYASDTRYAVYGVQGGSEVIPYIEVSGTLTAGSTSITLSNDLITTNSTIEPFTSVYGVNPTDIVIANGNVTLTFEAQSTDMGVKVRIS